MNIFLTQTYRFTSEGPGAMWSSFIMVGCTLLSFKLMIAKVVIH